MNLTYAPATQTDAPVIFTMSKALIDDYEIPETIDYDKVLGWVRRKIDTHITEYRCVYLDGQKAGYYRCCPGEGMMELDDLYILPEFRSRGIGTAIIQKCCAETDLPVMLYVFTRNTGAFALYRRLGFRVTREIGESRRVMVRQPGQEVV